MANAFQTSAFQRGAFQHYEAFVGIIVGGGHAPPFAVTREDGHADGALIVVLVDLIAGRATGSSRAGEQSIGIDLRCMAGIVAGNAIAAGEMRTLQLSVQAGFAGGELYLSEDELLILAEAA